MLDKEISDQAERLLHLLNNPDVGWGGAAAKLNALYFLRNFGPYLPPSIKDGLLMAMQARFGITTAQLAFLMATEDQSQIDAILEAKDEEPKEIFPKDGWIARYLEFTNGQESPALFHFWNGVSIIGAALSRRVYFEKHYYRVYPNHYIVLVAPTGECRKSVSANIAINLLRDAGVIEILSEKATPEGILDLLAQQVTVSKSPKGGARIGSKPSLMVHAPELGVFLGKQEYNEGLVMLLTTIADCRDGPFDYMTRGKGRLTIPSPTLHLLGCITPDGLAKSIPQSAFEGGSISRIMFICQSSTPRVFPLPKPYSEPLRNWLQLKLNAFNQLDGPMMMTPRAEAWFDDWYRRSRKEKQDVMRLAGYQARKPDHLIRLSIVLNVSEELGYELDQPILEKSLKIIDFTQRFMGEAFSIVDSAEQGRHYQIVVDVINRAGGRIDHSTLLKRVYRYGVNADMLTTRITPTLEQAGLIKHIIDTAKKINYYVTTMKP